MEKQIKVAMIPDNTRIIINAGYDDSNEISEGREIEVYVPGIDIIDPDTSEVIGQYDLTKERLELTNVYSSYSVARKIKEEKRSPLSVAIGSAMLAEKTYIKYEAIAVNEQQNRNIKLDEKIINIGDLVKFV